MPQCPAVGRAKGGIAKEKWLMLHSKSSAGTRRLSWQSVLTRRQGGNAENKQDPKSKSKKEKIRRDIRVYFMIELRKEIDKYKYPKSQTSNIKM